MMQGKGGLIVKVEVGEGVTIEDSVQEDVDWIEAHFREGDRLEHEALGGGRTVIKDLFERCWTVRNGEDLIGYCGVAIPDGSSVLSPERFLCYMSSVNADKAKVKYVKMSRRVMQEIVSRVQPWVDVFLSLPNVNYRGSVIWHERVLKMACLKEMTWRGETFKLFRATRKEIMT